MEKVMHLLKALASGIKGQDRDALVNFYDFADSQLQSTAEKKALRYGTLAMIADAYNMRLRRIYYMYLFRKAIKKVN